MKTMILCLLVSAIWAGPKYTVCIEGGGSKTVMQVIDERGEVRTPTVSASGSNINVVGEEGVRAVFRTLLEGQELFLRDCRVVAGLAGVGTPEKKALVASMFEAWGIPRTQVHVLSDAEMALQLFDRDGIVLIAGTGSICFGKTVSANYRVGGLGKVLGDEGSGYQIGLHALKAALAEEYGWGEATSLTAALREFFGVTELKTLIRPIGLGEFSSAKVASAAPIVFEHAHRHDSMAESIIDEAAEDLAMLLETMLQKSGLHDCDVHLLGGVFKNMYAEDFIRKIEENCSLLQTQRIRLVNQSNQNVALLYARKFAAGSSA